MVALAQQVTDAVLVVLELAALAGITYLGRRIGARTDAPPTPAPVVDLDPHGEPGRTPPPPAA